jgi:hypothetical protein
MKYSLWLRYKGEALPAGNSRFCIARVRSQKSPGLRLAGIDRMTGTGFRFSNELVDEGDCHTAFSDARCDTFHRAVTDVPGCKDSWNTGLEQIWIARLHRIGKLQIDDVASRADKALCITHQGVWEPRRFGPRADEDEERVGGKC